MSKTAAFSAGTIPGPFSPTATPEATCRRRRVVAGLATAAGLLCFVATHGGRSLSFSSPGRPFFGCPHDGTLNTSPASPFGLFPRPDDPLHFLPCTNATLPPKLDDTDPSASWAQLYEPDPAHWSWGAAKTDVNGENAATNETTGPYAGRGIYLCGYLDVPLDWTNASDARIMRLAVTKYQVAGPGARTNAKSSRTIIIEPGGPGGSGTLYAWHGAEAVSQRLSNGTLDVLGWDPRGVNATQPAASCFPYNADRDRWWQLAHRYRAVSLPDTQGQLEVADAYYEATFHACWKQHGDLGRFVGTGMVARDLDAIRAALAEPQLTGYLVSYGTGIGQTYANLFPDHAGRLILDGTQYAPVEWQQGGFGWGALDNVTNAWHDGFLGECLAAGPDHCALAQPRGDGVAVTLASLEARMAALVAAVAARPVVAYTAASGPSIVTYSSLVASLYATLYQPRTWPGTAQMLFDLEHGNSSLVAAMLERLMWQYDPSAPPVAVTQPGIVPAPGQACPVTPPPLPATTNTDELMPLVICADSYDAPQPETGLLWWDALWTNMTDKSWIAGNSRFYNVLPCRHFATYWPQPAGVFRGPLNSTLASPVMLVAETHDPATPLANGRRLAAAMGYGNARMLVHHGYGHASAADPSDCTDAVLRAYIMAEAIPQAAETHCFASGKPYLYNVEKNGAVATKEMAGSREEQMLAVWQEHVKELMMWNPGLVRGSA